MGTEVTFCLHICRWFLIWGSTQLNNLFVLECQTKNSTAKLLLQGQEHHWYTRASLQEHHCQTFTVHHRTSIYQLSTADHYMSWNNTLNPPRSHLVAMLSPEMGGCSKNYLYGTLDWFYLWLGGSWKEKSERSGHSHCENQPLLQNPWTQMAVSQSLSFWWIWPWLK